MSDVKIVVSADGANSEAVLKAVTDAVKTFGAQIKSVAETSKKEKDAFDVLTKTWGKNWHDLSETANNSLELIKKGISGAKSAFDYLREGADISEAQQNFRAYAASIGKDADDLMKKMRQASKNQVSDMELMESATKALRLGVAKDYLVGEIVEVQSVNPARCNIISNIEWRWLQRFCPELLVRHPLLSSSDPSSESLNRCLNEVFRQKPLLKNNGLVRTCYYSGCDYSSITEAFSR